MILNDLSQTSKNTLQVIRSIPTSIGYYTSISEIYVTQRKLVSTEKQLKEFTKTWNSVWKIGWYTGWTPTRIESQIVSGRYNAKAVLRCLDKNRPMHDGCSHIVKHGDCISAQIMAPYFLLKLKELSDIFIAPEGVVLLQLVRAVNPDLKNQDSTDILLYINS